MKTISGKQYAYIGIFNGWYIFVDVRSGHGAEVQMLQSVRYEVAPNVYSYYNPSVDGSENIKEPPFAVPNRYQPERSCYSRMKLYNEWLASLASIEG